MRKSYQANDISLYRRMDKNTRDYRMSKEIYDKAVTEGRITPLTRKQKVEHTVRKWVKPEKIATSAMTLRTGKDGRNGDGYGKMTPIQKSHFLESIKLGCGEALSCVESGVSWQVYRQACIDDPDWKAAVKLAMDATDGELDRDIHAAALDSDNIADKIAARRIKLDVRMKKEYGVLERRKLELRRLEIDSKSRAIDHIVKSAPINIKNLSDEEMEKYSDLFSRIKGGEDLGSAEALEYVNLTRKIAAPSQAETAKQLSNINTVDSLFSNDDDG